MKYYVAITDKKCRVCGQIHGYYTKNHKIIVSDKKEDLADFPDSSIVMKDEEDLPLPIILFDDIPRVKID